MSAPRRRQPAPPERFTDDLFWILFLLACFFSWGMLVSGCGVRSVTTCITYDRALQRPDPQSFVQRDSAGASMCVEAGPR